MGICHTQVFSGPREFAAFLGLTPKQTSSGGKERLGRVSKMGKRMTASSQARGCGGPCHRFAPTGSVYDPEAEAKPYLARAHAHARVFNKPEQDHAEKSKIALHEISRIS